MRPVTEETGTHRDPAPSLWAYRWHRLWLTPVFRLLLRVGIPASVVALSVLWLVTDPRVHEWIETSVADMRRSVAERPEFMVKMMAIDGASHELSEDIREVLPIDFPVSSFDLALDQMKTIVEELDAVASADLHIRPGGILQLNVLERVPALIWRNRGMVELLDATGRRVAALRQRGERTDLPLIAGVGADRAATEALALFRAADPLAERLLGLQRVGNRRWDLVLDREQRIMLPETNPVQALEQVLALDKIHDLLGRNVVLVDMRNTERPTVRLHQSALAELHKIKALERGELLR